MSHRPARCGLAANQDRVHGKLSLPDWYQLSEGDPRQSGTNRNVRSQRIKPIRRRRDSARGARPAGVVTAPGIWKKRHGGRPSMAGPFAGFTVDMSPSCRTLSAYAADYVRRRSQKQTLVPAQHITICHFGKHASVLTQRHCPGPQYLAPASSSGCVPVHVGAPMSHAHTGALSQQRQAVAVGKQLSLFRQ